MARNFKEAKLLYLRPDQKQKLLKIQEEVEEAGGDTNLNQLIRDSIDVVVGFYKDEIVERYSPRTFKSLEKSS